MIEQLKKVWQKRELLWYIVKLQMKAEKKNKVLGFVWSFLDPLLLLVTYVILVRYIFQRGGPQFPVPVETFSQALPMRCRPLV